MSIYKKLSEARVKLQEKGLKRSGKNTYSNYEYFELKDFLPEVNRIFNELGLCGVVSFTNELAILTIYNTEGDGKIEFTSPMAKASLKGCHEIQNLGAVETYQRRYLYMAALEIVDGDVLDENTGNPKAAPKPEPPKYSKQSTPPSTNITQGEVIDKLKSKLEGKTKEECAQIYDKSIDYLGKKYPELIDEYNLMYNDWILNLI
ncbi:ERF family protein [Aggregatibacter actinomycetemcomitans]|uniref:ERF family protein n=1 Tax=Aggregatibacter actinomycetemcomitans TaxID=714 RepID=UPI00197C32EA|nr:ERF family protein [Aggregatibacter actinomycetemcomitans]MBN6068871.1 ERF family protein [Aggregatibacter actinomycetemcomitans]MBN6068957.1 ERF family protein [Aggregatibacter actinomycetemcomitans]MBN6069023.1 ERF family protein [Aggregatibacter actinomycetemcomitans]MBN6069505.1 ERF family protein [Aggregatibacter actinomycetemcomitans]MBN6086866.1 ERF family protein [Aggregatibacter actinomycetemcomitans]